MFKILESIKVFINKYFYLVNEHIQIFVHENVL